jgi:hypothetical protein
VLLHQRHDALNVCIACGKSHSFCSLRGSLCHAGLVAFLLLHGRSLLCIFPPSCSLLRICQPVSLLLLGASGRLCNRLLRSSISSARDKPQVASLCAVGAPDVGTLLAAGVL